MFRRTLVLAALCGFLLSPLAGAAEPEAKLAPKYRLELEIRKPGAPRTVAAESYYDAAGRLYYATPDSKALAATKCAAPAAAKEVVRPKWVRGFDLRVWAGERECFNGPKVTVEVFRDAGRLLYVSESGAMASLPEPAGEAKVANPRFVTTMQLKVRPGGENDFTRNYLKLNLAVYLHEPTGHLIYVGHNGALAVVETKKTFDDLKTSEPRWSHAMDLRVRKTNQEGFNANTPRLAMEVFADENAGVLLYATDALTLAAAPGAVKELWGRDIKAPEWKTQLVSGKFAAEVFANPNANHTVVVTYAGGLAVLPDEAKQPEKADPPKANGVNVATVGVLSVSGKVVFLPTGGGTEAVAIFNGKPLWSTDNVGDPLLATADHVFSQLQMKGKKNQVKLVMLDATTGERVRESDVIKLPEWVSVPREYGHSFRSAARLDKGDVFFVWEARTFQDGGRPPPDPDPNAKHDSGAVRVDVKTGRVTVVKDYKPKEEEFPQVLSTKTKASGWVFWVEQVPNTISTPRALIPRFLKAEREDGKESWKRPIAGEVFLPPRP